jgi:hypothetical protein
VRVLCVGGRLWYSLREIGFHWFGHVRVAELSARSQGEP